MSTKLGAGFTEYTAEMKAIYCGAGGGTEFAMVTQDFDVHGETRQITSEAHIEQKRKFGYAMVHGLSSEYSFDMLDDAAITVDHMMGSAEDIAKEAMATAFLYEKK